MTGKILTMVAVVGLAASPALSQEALVKEQGDSDLRGDWILGGRVKSTEDEHIGSIEDLIIDEDEGAVSAAIVSVGGFLGFGAKQIAVDWNELEIDYDANEIVLDISREEAEEADDYVYRERASRFSEEMESRTGTGTGSGTGTGTGTGGN